MKRQKSFGNREDAESFLRRMSAKDAGITLSRCISTYIEAHPEMTKKRSKEYQILIQYNGIAETLKDMEITSFTDEDLNSIRVIGIQQGLSPQTINYKTGLLKTIFTWAKQNNLIDDVPWLYSKKMKSKGGSFNASPKDFLRIYTNLPDWAQWACRTCIALCLRPGDGELFSLNWSDFNWEEGTVKVYMSKVKRYKVSYPPKEYLAEAFDRFKQSQEEYVIPSVKGGRAYAVYFDVVWQRTRERLGISENVKPYCMRHIAATGGVVNGATTSIMGAQLGHAHSMFTQMTYIHTTANKDDLNSTRESSVFNDFFIKKEIPYEL